MSGSNDGGAKVDFLRGLGVTNLPTGAAASAPTPPPAASPPPANAGWQGSVAASTAATSHAVIGSGAPVPNDSSNQLQVAATYQAHPENQAGLEIGLNAALAQTTDATGARSQTVGAGAQVQGVLPVGPALVGSQRLTLSAAAGVNLNLVTGGTGTVPQLQPFAQVQASLPISANAALTASLQQAVSAQSGSPTTTDTQVAVGLTVTFP